ncbi:hypothetical protein HIM_07362 [Hirsutella minnesotensis 3608]|uniref:Uncharacterized protein n=1 Tax=Hirsutella minnesotensis 3608 TaxID=1043627 RepID=A0A0F7ZN56_9HYPO|nr:hypothetical protein HIM_07362 [Hirsutella minnesotensis 3608]
MDDAKCPIRIPGFTHNGDCNLICKPSGWKDILVFFLGNYGAHAATVIGRPGQSNLTRAFSLVLALFFPGTGVLAGVTAIASLALFAPTELTRAARAGALCVVVRVRGGTVEEDIEAAPLQPEALEPDTANHGSRGDDTEPRTEPAAPESSPPHHIPDGHQAQGRTIENEETAAKQPVTLDTRLAHEAGPQTLDGRADEVLPSSLMASQVHGIARLPAGYRLLVLPGWTTFELDNDDDEKEISQAPSMTFTKRFRDFLGSPFKAQPKLTSTVPCSYNVIKVLISIGQLLFSVLTLYETRGNQLAVYGYAAFGLTVAPYFWMSLVNLLGNLMCPQYPNIFIVNSPTLDRLRREIEAKGLSARYPFDGTVGRISQETEARVLDANAHLLRCTTALEIFFSRLDTETDKSSEAMTLAFQAIAAYIVAAVPIAIVGGISRFDPGQSATYQRVWTMMWLCFGPMVGIGYGMWILPLFESWPVLWRTLMTRKASELSDAARVPGHHEKVANPRGEDGSHSDDAPRFVIWVHIGRFALEAAFVGAYMAPAIGGYVTVAQMLLRYGTCNKIN